jgi:hypothetical protein
MSKARQLADLGNQVDDGSITGTNMVVNGGLTVWQRGTSHAAGSGINYTADRFWRYNPSATGTIERSTDAPDGFEYSLFFNVTGGGNNLGTGVELTRQGFFPQQMYTLSMYLKGDFSGTSIYINFRNSAGSGTDNVDITTFNSFGNYSDWTRVTIPVDTTGISPNANNLFMNMEFGGFPDGGKITGVCLNVGDSAIDFPHESYGETLAKCQRYFYRYTGASDDRWGVSYSHNNSTTSTSVSFPVTMRSTPTGVVSSNGLLRVRNLADGLGGDITPSTLSCLAATKDRWKITVNAQLSNAAQILAFATKLDFDAEL